MATRSLQFSLLRLDGDARCIQQNALLAALGRLPNLGDLRLSGEDDLEGRAVGGAVNALLSWRKLDALFAL